LREQKNKERTRQKAGKRPSDKPRSFDDQLYEMIYRPEVQRFIEGHIEIYEDDPAINMLQISYI
jgi:hypothetical protein